MKKTANPANTCVKNFYVHEIATEKRKESM